jgi:hypothetical protein
MMQATQTNNSNDNSTVSESSVNERICIDKIETSSIDDDVSVTLKDDSSVGEKDGLKGKPKYNIEKIGLNDSFLIDTEGVQLAVTSRMNKLNEESAFNWTIHCCVAHFQKKILSAWVAETMAAAAQVACGDGGQTGSCVLRRGSLSSDSSFVVDMHDGRNLDGGSDIRGDGNGDGTINGTGEGEWGNGIKVMV